MACGSSCDVDGREGQGRSPGEGECKAGRVQKGREGTQTPLRANCPGPAQGTSKWLLVLPWSWQEQWPRDKPEQRVYVADPCWLLKEMSRCSVLAFSQNDEYTQNKQDSWEWGSGKTWVWNTLKPISFNRVNIW